VPANGFYEWQTAGRVKRPFVLRPDPLRRFAFAGLWEAWRGPDGTVVETFTILTPPRTTASAPITTACR
jgi:putative SOS response-associated peptidase YedK